jgi:hypothetical protein
MEARHACDPNKTVAVVCRGGHTLLSGSLLIGRPLFHLGPCTRQPTQCGVPWSCLCGLETGLAVWLVAHVVMCALARFEPTSVVRLGVSPLLAD